MKICLLQIEASLKLFGFGILFAFISFPSRARKWPRLIIFQTDGSYMVSLLFNFMSCFCIGNQVYVIFLLWICPLNHELNFHLNALFYMPCSHKPTTYKRVQLWNGQNPLQKLCRKGTTLPKSCEQHQSSKFIMN